jgi:hypothetical protein
VLPSTWTHVAADRSRQYYVMVPHESAVAIFDPDGDFVRAVGRPGDGPGEFRNMRFPRTSPEDSLYVFQAGRYAVFSPELAFTRTVNLAAAVDEALPIGAGRLVISSRLGTAERIWRPLHLVNADGRLTWSFGESDRPVLPNDPDSHVRRLGTAVGGCFWAARVNEYRIELWDTTGTRLATVRRDAEWFPAWSGLDLREGYDLRPRPRIAAVTQDDDDRLWVFLRVASEQWRPEPTPRTEREFRLPTLEELARRWDTVVEVLDIRSGEVIASARRPEVMSIVPGTRKVWAVQQDEVGVVSIPVWRAELTGAPPRDIRDRPRGLADGC